VTESVENLSMLIDGAMVSSDTFSDVINPATGEVVYRVPDCSREELDVAMNAAQRAYREWRVDDDRRREILRACAKALENSVDELARVQTLEQGMPLAASVQGIQGSAANFDRYADLEIPVVTVKDDDEALIQVVRRPLGVVAAIKPWNVPIGQAVGVIAPALRAGCTVVLKPSEYTPAATLVLGEILRDVIPTGVLNIVSGSGEVGSWMVEHPIPRGISFTGSVATGKKVNAMAAPDLKRVLLELGGNDAAIVLDDVDPDVLAERIFWTAFRNSGQICMATKRVYVPEALHDPIVASLARIASAVKVGDGMEESTELGPLCNSMQYERVKGLVADAIKDGATVAAGGNAIDSSGYFFEPTILANAHEGMRIVDEEQFGPALPILTYKTLDEVIDRANATNFGLGASVWSSDTGRAAEVAALLESGNAWVNTHSQQHPNAPFGGAKWSGVGSQNGLYSIFAYTDPQTTWTSRRALTAGA
jgi:acyl-CoA reductase-like NAD-dependent aldehyde dehydrogenase